MIVAYARKRDHFSKCCGGHDLDALAIAALGYVMLYPSFLNWVDLHSF